MPSEVTDIKQFLEIARRKDASCATFFPPLRDCADLFLAAARIKKSTKTKDIKFKVRCNRYLYTLILKDSEKADKLKQSLPPSAFVRWSRRYGLLTAEQRYNRRRSARRTRRRSLLEVIKARMVHHE